MGNLVSNGPWKFLSVFFFQAGELCLYYLSRNLSEVVLVVGIKAMDVFFLFLVAWMIGGLVPKQQTPSLFCMIHGQFSWIEGFDAKLLMLQAV